VDGENHCSVVVLDQVNQAFDDVKGIVCVQSACWLVQEENAGRCYKLACNTNTTLLSAGNTTAAFLGANFLVANVVDTELSLDIFDLLLLGCATHLLGKTQ
jgi:hypothetical protein